VGTCEKWILVKWVTYVPLVDNTEIVLVEARYTGQGRFVFGDEFLDLVVVRDVDCDNLVLRGGFVSADVK
jgi:hypothetical protein